MSDDPKAAPPIPSPEDLVKQFVSANMVPGAQPPPPSKGALRRKLIIGGVIAGLGLGASFMSCVGQSFSYRQARAMEGIEEQLKEIRASCPAFAPAVKN